jgi:uncharacterized protein YjbI with pentapeptide repeats
VKVAVGVELGVGVEVGASVGVRLAVGVCVEVTEAVGDGAAVAGEEVGVATQATNQPAHINNQTGRRMRFMHALYQGTRAASVFSSLSLYTSGMKLPYPGPIHAPRLPRRLPAQSLPPLKDNLTVGGFSASGTDWSNQSAAFVTLEQASLRRTNLTGTYLKRARMLDLRWEMLDSAAGEWQETHLRRCEFLGCRLLGMQWLEVDLEDVRFEECVLEGSFLVNSKLRGVHFENCVLRGCTMEYCRLDEVDLRGCNLSYAILRETSLAGVDLRGATLDALQIPAEALRGAVITPAQAIQTAALLGVRLLDEEAPLEEDELKKQD